MWWTARLGGDWASQRGRAGEGPGVRTPEQMLTSAPPSPPGSGEPPAICEISPLVSYSGEVRAARPIWGSSGVGLVWSEDGGGLGAWWEVTALPQSTSGVSSPLVAEDFPRRGLRRGVERPRGVREDKPGSSEPGVWARGNVAGAGDLAPLSLESSGLHWGRACPDLRSQDIQALLLEASLPCPSLTPG